MSGFLLALCGLLLPSGLLSSVVFSSASNGFLPVSVKALMLRLFLRALLLVSWLAESVVLLCLICFVRIVFCQCIN